jgi:hypothetical protein
MAASIQRGMLPSAGQRFWMPHQPAHQCCRCYTHISAACDHTHCTAVGGTCSLGPCRTAAAPKQPAQGETPTQQQAPPSTSPYCKHPVGLALPTCPGPDAAHALLACGQHTWLYLSALLYCQYRQNAGTLLGWRCIHTSAKQRSCCVLVSHLTKQLDNFRSPSQLLQSAHLACPRQPAVTPVLIFSRCCDTTQPPNLTHVAHPNLCDCRLSRQIVVRLQTQLTAAGCCSTHTLPLQAFAAGTAAAAASAAGGGCVVGPLVIDAPATVHTQVSAQTQNTTVQHMQQAASCDMVTFTRCCTSACRRWQAQPSTGLQSPAHLPALLFCWKQTTQPAPCASPAALPRSQAARPCPRSAGVIHTAALLTPLLSHTLIHHHTTSALTPKAGSSAALPKYML